MAKNIVRHVQDGVEFFTVWATGESGLSKSGLALFCGVSQQAVSKLFARIEKTSQPNDLPESLKPLCDKPLKLTTGIVEGTKYSNVDIVPDDACAAVIEYYAFDAPNPTNRAKQSIRGFVRVGLRVYIHARTGWTADSQNVRGYLFGLILDAPKRWEEHFPEEWRLEAERLTEWRWEWSCFSKFLNETVYSYFPQEMRDRLDEVNPVGENGHRPRKQHQHFEGEASEALKQHIKTVYILMQASSSIHEFRRLMDSKFQGRYQLSLRL
jgi:hypothetical protein